jgi:TetR/AcrR family transcriptional regulator, regulator of autoinduction and epiphytic fitness
MARVVKTTRRYNSPRRQEQAAATRRAILDAAQELFERQGYAATTMESISSEAGVALKTVYLAFVTKSGLLRALWDVLLKGDESEAPVAERPWYREVVEEPDPERRLRLNARNSRVVKVRIAAVLEVIRDAASADPDIAALWRLIQSDFYDNQRAIVHALHETNGLRPDLDVTRATDILWTLNHPDVWLLLVGQRGWTPEEFEAWLADTTCSQLLGRRARPTPRRRKGRTATPTIA